MVRFDSNSRTLLAPVRDSNITFGPGHSAQCPAPRLGRVTHNTTPAALIIPLGDLRPDISADAWVAPNATLVGSIVLADRVGVWYSAVLRAESESITIGPGSNLQDGVTAHVDPGFPLRVGSGVSVGHNAVLHGCTVEDDCLIGMGAVVLNGAVIGTGSLVAAGALIPQGMVVPPRSLVAGVPAKVRRELSDDEVGAIRYNATHYEGLLVTHRDAVG